MAALNNFGVGYNNYGIPQYSVPLPSQLPSFYPNQSQNQQMKYVHGIEGANAYQMAPGETEVLLWDDEKDSFYVKKLDQMGRPKVVAWKDFTDHVEPEQNQEVSEASNIDLNKYLTKDDLHEILKKLGLTDILTKADLDKALSELSVGTGGKVVRGNEFTA